MWGCLYMNRFGRATLENLSSNKPQMLCFLILTVMAMIPEAKHCKRSVETQWEVTGMLILCPYISLGSGIRLGGPSGQTPCAGPTCSDWERIGSSLPHFWVVWCKTGWRTVRTSLLLWPGSRLCRIKAIPPYSLHINYSVRKCQRCQRKSWPIISALL
jgi:hypothetical protein